MRASSACAPPRVRDDGKLGGLGHATLGRSTVLPCGSPSPPLLHEVKLSGPGTGGGLSFGSVRRVSWPSSHEVKLSGPGTGGGLSFGSVRRVSWPSSHEVKLSGPGTGGQVSFGSVRRVSWPSSHEVKLSGRQEDALSPRDLETNQETTARVEDCSTNLGQALTMSTLPKIPTQTPPPPLLSCGWWSVFPKIWGIVRHRKG